MRQTGKSARDLTEGSVIKHVFRLAIPMIIAFIFVTGYNFVDRYFVAQLGDVATAAIGMAFIVQLMMISIGSGLGSGINSFISRSLGAGKTDQAVNGALHGILLALIIGLAFTVGGLLSQRMLYRAMGADGELLELITAYLTVIFLFTPVNILTMFCSSIFQGWGDTMSPMKFMLLGNILNLILDPLLIFGLGSIPAFGIMGAALATGIGRLVALSYVAVKVIGQKQPIKLSFKGFKYQPSILTGIFQVGLPSSISQILTSTAMGFIFFVLTPYGEFAKAAYTIVFTYEMVVFLPSIGIAQAVVILTGHNFGAQKLDRVNKVYFTGILVAASLMIIPALVIILFPTFFAGIFAQDPEVLTIASGALQITIFGSIFYSINMSSVASFQGLGLGRHYLVANIVRLYVLLVPGVFLFSYLLGLEGVWIGLLVVNITSAVVLFAWHRYIFHFKVRAGSVKAL